MEEDEICTRLAGDEGGWWVAFDRQRSDLGKSAGGGRESSGSDAAGVAGYLLGRAVCVPAGFNTLQRHAGAQREL